jgi:Mn2+/Fe2+ NRAMP family transporter
LFLASILATIASEGVSHGEYTTTLSLLIEATTREGGSFTSLIPLMSTNPYDAPAADLDHDAETIDGIENPPQSISGIVSRLGPGLIIAAAIVGSGELIATTKTGASAGFTLLWLILIGCVIKVFAQIEIGRFTMTEGRTAIDAFDQVPGPRLKVSWLCWYWLFMYVCSIGQLGGIVGVVGQSLAISAPFTGDYNLQLIAQKDDENRLMRQAEFEEVYNYDNEDDPVKIAKQIKIKVEFRKKTLPTSPISIDVIVWTLITAVLTSIMLVIGKYGFVQHASTIMVAAFTFMSVANLIALQTTAQWAISWNEIWQGLSFQIPDGAGLATCLATFGIIGVGASELVAYPYWCLEKGYARAAGPRNETAAWSERARGWFRVLRWDCWASMGIYTFATIAFYLTGATVLHRASLTPGDEQLIPTLLEMYRPVFGEAAEWIFLFGAFAVLYSTFFVASAGNARMAADGLRVFGLVAKDDETVKRWTRYLCGAIPLIAMLIYFANPKPVSLVMISGLAQAVMLPMLGFAALYYRYYRCDARLKPGPIWTAFLWLSFGGLLITGGWGVYSNWSKLSELLFP